MNELKAGVDYIGICTPFYCHDGKGNLLLAKRSQRCRDERGAWEPGGGQLHFGETPEQGVLREIKEEYGCEGIIDGALPPHSIFRELDGVSTHWLMFPFFVRVNPAEVINNEPENIDEIAWRRLAELPAPLHTGFVTTLQKYREHFEKYLS